MRTPFNTIIGSVTLSKYHQVKPQSIALLHPIIDNFEQFHHGLISPYYESSKHAIRDVPQTKITGIIFPYLVETLPPIIYPLTFIFQSQALHQWRFCGTHILTFHFYPWCFVVKMWSQTSLWYCIPFQNQVHSFCVGRVISPVIRFL